MALSMASRIEALSLEFLRLEIAGILVQVRAEHYPTPNAQTGSRSPGPPDPVKDLDTSEIQNDRAIRVFTVLCLAPADVPQPMSRDVSSAQGLLDTDVKVEGNV
jgi:hypothetical protein